MWKRNESARVLLQGYASQVVILFRSYREVDLNAKLDPFRPFTRAASFVGLQPAACVRAAFTDSSLKRRSCVRSSPRPGSSRTHPDAHPPAVASRHQI